MPLKKQNDTETFQNLIEHIIWNTCERDDTNVIKYLKDTKSMDYVYGLDEAVLFDYLFNFMDEQGVMEILSKLDYMEGTVKREMLTGFQIIILYLMKCVKGIRGMNGCEDLLFTDEFAMRLASFNANKVRDGICQRGLDRGERGFTDIRGIINNDTLANNIVKFKPEEVFKRYNQIVARLVKNKSLPKNVHAVLDCTELETTSSFEGCGKVSKEKAVNKRGSHQERKRVTVYGFKLWAVYVPSVELPIAVYVDTIDVHDIKHARRVVEQAIQNLGEHVKIKSLAIDRGFLDGKFLWWVGEEVGIQFYIPAKENLSIRDDVIRLSLKAEEVMRERKVSRGHGKNKREEIKITKLKKVNDLSCDFYNPLGSGSHTNSNDFNSGRLHAVLVTRDDTYAHDRVKNTIFLTNRSIDDPFDVYDRYDDRSLIENELNRSLKQAWYIENPPQKSAIGVKLHVYFVIICMSITSAFRQQQAKEEAMYPDDIGMERYRRKLRASNKDKLAIFVNDKYGIFIAYEPFVVMDIGVREAARLGATKESILNKYGVNSNQPNQ